MEAVITDKLHPLISKNSRFCCMRSKIKSQTRKGFLKLQPRNLRLALVVF